MKILLVFDGEPFSIDSIAGKDDRVDLFPITGDWAVIRRLEKKCEGEGLNFNRLLAAHELRQASEELIPEFIEGSAALGKSRVGKKTVKEWFLDPSGSVSGWWFSLFSGKNPLGTDVFLHVSQARALRHVLNRGGYDRCVLCVHYPRLRWAVRQIAEGAQVSVRQIKGRFSESPRGGGGPVLNAGRLFPATFDFLGSFYWFGVYVLRGMMARWKIGSIFTRRTDPHDLLIVSYFPAFDRGAAERGIFVNTYLEPLQKRLQEKGRKLHWLLLTSNFGRMKFSQAVALGKKFLESGDSLSFMEEYITVRVAFQSCVAWFLQIARCLIFLLRAPRKISGVMVAFPEGALLTPLWVRSFLGWSGFLGFIYYYAFREFIRQIGHAHQCVYLAEMLPWEKALNAARRSVAPSMEMIGFQYGPVPPLYLPYFHSLSELHNEGRPEDLPMPDIMAVNGPEPEKALANYPRIQSVEAVRQMHLKEWLEKPCPAPQAPPILLVAGSYDRGSTRSLLSLMFAAYPTARGFEVWLNGHPCSPVQEAVDHLGIDLRKAGYVIREEPARQLLPHVRWILVADSSVALDALALGREVFVAGLNDALFLSPLAGYENQYRVVYDPDQLRKELEKSLSHPWKAPIDRSFVSSYWNLDESLHRWEALLA